VISVEITAFGIRKTRLNHSIQKGHGFESISSGASRKNVY